MIGPLDSFGGPYVVLARGPAAQWRGAEDNVAYEAVCTGPDDGWEPMGAFVVVAGGLLALDAGAAGDDDSLEIDLAPGAYAVASRTFQPDDGTELILVRLRAD